MDSIFQLLPVFNPTKGTFFLISLPNQDAGVRFEVHETDMREARGQISTETEPFLGWWSRHSEWRAASGLAAFTNSVLKKWQNAPLKKETTDIRCSNEVLLWTRVELSKFESNALKFYRRASWPQSLMFIHLILFKSQRRSKVWHRFGTTYYLIVGLSSLCGLKTTLFRDLKLLQ